MSVALLAFFAMPMLAGCTETNKMPMLAGCTETNNGISNKNQQPNVKKLAIMLPNHLSPSNKMLFNHLLLSKTTMIFEYAMQTAKKDSKQAVFFY